MKFNLKKLLFASSLLLGLLFCTNAIAQSSCSGKDKKDAAKTECCASKSAKAKVAATSGCSPSACRGAKTKFGEAKVISDLRLSLIALKTDMEKSKSPSFDAKAYDIHGIVGETDDESLEIITKEVRGIESVFAEKLSYKPAEFTLPENKAKQVKYLNTRIEELKKQLL